MLRYIFIILFLTSSCSIYDLSGPKIDDLLKNKESIIVLSPSTEDTLFADSITLEAIVQDSLGIKSITITPPTVSGLPIIINPIGSPKNFGISQKFLVKNGIDYDSADGQYTIKIEFENSAGEIIEKEFTFIIKLISVDYTFSLVGITGDLKPTPPTVGWGTSGFHIVTTSDGAPLQRIEVAGTLGSFVTNAPFLGAPPTVSIRMDEIGGTTVPFGTVSMNIRIISDTGGTSMETVVLVDP